MNFSVPVVVQSETQAWDSSPATGVSRMRLEREAAESGHVTSFVRYEAGASFPEHAHPNGEEIVVLEGEFCDEHG